MLLVEDFHNIINLFDYVYFKNLYGQFWILISCTSEKTLLITLNETLYDRDKKMIQKFEHYN